MTNPNASRTHCSKLYFHPDKANQLAERRSLAGELTLSCARPAADAWPLCKSKPSAAGQPTRPTQPFILSGSTNE